MRSIFAILAVFAFTANALQVVDEDVESQTMTEEEYWAAEQAQLPTETSEEAQEESPPYDGPETGEEDEEEKEEELVGEPEGDVVEDREIPQEIGVYRSYADPNHRKCPRVLYFVGNTVKFTGMDGPASDGGHCDKIEETLNEEEFTFDGVIDGDKIVIDFSSKGGPKDLTGTISREANKDITWADGNKWTEMIHQLDDGELTPEDQQAKDTEEELELERSQMRRRGIDGNVQETVEGEPTPEELKEMNPYGETSEEEEVGEPQVSNVDEVMPALKDDEIMPGVKKMSPEEEAEMIKRVSAEVKAGQERFWATYGITPEEEQPAEEQPVENEDKDDPGPDPELEDAFATPDEDAEAEDAEAEDADDKPPTEMEGDATFERIDGDEAEATPEEDEPLELEPSDSDPANE